MFDDGRLPLLEDDVPLVLPAGTVLREQARQVRAVHAENRGCPLPGSEPADAVSGETARKKCLRVADDPLVRTVEEESEPIAAAGPDDVSVT